MGLMQKAQCTVCGSLNYDMTSIVIDPNTGPHEVAATGQDPPEPLACPKCGHATPHRTVFRDDPNWQPQWYWDAKEAQERASSSSCALVLVLLTALTVVTTVLARTMLI